MKNPFSFLVRTRVAIPGEQTVSGAIRKFSYKERFAFSIFIVLMTVSVFGLLFVLDKHFVVETPRTGGSFTEGTVGFPRFINPLLASSDTDRDLTALIYSGLMRVGEDGSLIPDLASSYTISEDGRTYTFILKDNLLWQDHTQVTADDVVFTIQKAQDPALRSPRRANWEGVTAEALDSLTVRFTLSQAYTPFLQNTTMGILPKHIWGDVSSEQFSFSRYNIEPVGTGPYEVKSVTRDRGGIPQYYDLKAFPDFALGEAYITHLRFFFFSNEKDLLNGLAQGKVESVNSMEASIAYELSTKGENVLTSPLPRVFGVFFNQSHAPVFTDKAAREALSVAVDRESLIESILSGYGTPLYGPLPPGTLGFIPEDGAETATSTSRTEKARQMLEDGGWEYNDEDQVFEKTINKELTQLSFSISTSAVPELKEAAQALKTTWEALGARVEVKIFDTGNLDQTVIRPRDYDALLFGEIIARDSDPFAFWHSSQRLDPGLNISLYTNSSVDKILEEARVTLNDTERAEMYADFASKVINDAPAVFLYAPDFLYLVPERIKGVGLTSIAIPSDRFTNIYKWYVNTQKIWQIFAS